MQSVLLSPDFLQGEFNKLVLDVFRSVLVEFGLSYSPLHCKWVLICSFALLGVDVLGVQYLFIHYVYLFVSNLPPRLLIPDAVADQQLFSCQYHLHSLLQIFR